MDKPDVDFIEFVSSHLHRSKIVEPQSALNCRYGDRDLWDYLTVVVARIGKPLARNAADLSEQQSVEQIQDRVMRSG